VVFWTSVSFWGNVFALRAWVALVLDQFIGTDIAQTPVINFTKSSL
jgi:hypothetical protein